MGGNNHSKPDRPAGAAGGAGSRPVMVAAQSCPRSGAGSREDGRRGLRHARRLRSAAAPDLAEVARDAVLRFLLDASAATAQRAAGQPGETGSARAGSSGAAGATGTGRPGAAGGGFIGVDEGPPGGTAPVTGHVGPDSTAWGAAAMSVATLDRIEAAAAKVEADIAAALRAQAELQAAAGAAAEAAVRAAESARVASHGAAQSEQRAKVVLHRIEHYVTITVILLIISIIILVITATPAM